MPENNTTMDKCYIISEIVNKMRDIYNKSNIKQKAFLETIIGAALWYLPKPSNYWSGFISIDLIKGFSSNKNTKISEEHIIPRKISAKELLKIDIPLTAEYINEKYLSKYCKIHYLTQDENKRARKYQKDNVYTNSDDVYKKAEIVLIEINENILRKVKEGNIEVINKILELNKYGKNVKQYFEIEVK